MVVLFKVDTEYFHRLVQLNQWVQLDMDRAIFVEPLTDQQIDDYLMSLGERGTNLHAMLQDDADVREMAKIPLMLNILTLGCQGKSSDKIVATLDVEAKQRQVFDFYVQRILNCRGDSISYTAEQTRHWLAFLARQMEQRNQSTFYIENMQPDWLSDGRSGKVYEFFAVWFPRIVMGIFVSLLVDALLLPDPFDISAMVIDGLMGILVVSLLSERRLEKQSTKSNAISSKGWWYRLITNRAIDNGILIGLATIVTLRFINRSIINQSIIIGGVLFGILFGLSSLLLTVALRGKGTSISQVETSTNVSRNGWCYLKNGLLMGGFIGLIPVLIYDPIFSPIYWDFSKPLNGLFVWLNGLAPVPTRFCKKKTRPSLGLLVGGRTSFSGTLKSPAQNGNYWSSVHFS